MPTPQKFQKFNPRNVNQPTIECSQAGFESVIKNFMASSSVLSSSDCQCRLFKPEHNDSAVKSLSPTVDMLLWINGKRA